METPFIAPIPQKNRFFDLRPMSIGDFLDRVVYFYRTHFVSLALYSLIFAIPNTVLTFFSTWFTEDIANTPVPSTDPAAVFGQLGQLYGLIILLNIVSTFIIAFQAAGVAAAVKAAFMEGRHLSTGEMLAEVRKKAGSLVGIAFVSLLLWVPITCSLLIPPIYMAIGTLYSFGVFLAYSIVMYENREVKESLRRGWLLICSGGKRALALLLVYLLFSYIFSALLLGVLTIPVTMIDAVNESSLLSAAIQSIISLFSYIILTPFTFSSFSFLYFDLRVRSEGLDVALMSSMGSNEPMDLATAPTTTETVMGEIPRRSVLTLAGIYTILLVVLCGGAFAFFALVGYVAGTF